METENDENKYEVIAYDRDIDFIEDQQLLEKISNLNK